MKIELENVLPREIEKRSFELITEELGERTFPEEQEPIIKRCIHTSADFDYADNLCFSEGVVEKAKENWGAYGRRPILLIDRIPPLKKSNKTNLIPF